MLSTLAAAAILGVSAPAQSVISARSGVVQFFEGSVFLDSERLEPRLGKYPLIADGAQLRTERGRAEVLLTPGVFLRIGDNTSIRLIRSELADTQVELSNGSATIDCTPRLGNP